ncbi:unnamed protein product [Urochloa humidicola]
MRTACIRTPQTSETILAHSKVAIYADADSVPLLLQGTATQGTHSREKKEKCVPAAQHPVDEVFRGGDTMVAFSPDHVGRERLRWDEHLVDTAVAGKTAPEAAARDAAVRAGGGGD